MAGVNETQRSDRFDQQQKFTRKNSKNYKPFKQKIIVIFNLIQGVFLSKFLGPP
ncbi:MAG: hypothetical protein LBC02_09575 [Planctomycetaceae bacterium]|jgi:hypothetical protein|nr:hypothetical protein [Planctomycetaceae bacterium]